MALTVEHLVGVMQVAPVGMIRQVGAGVEAVALAVLGLALEVIIRQVGMVGPASPHLLREFLLYTAEAEAAVAGPSLLPGWAAGAGAMADVTTRQMGTLERPTAVVEAGAPPIALEAAAAVVL